MCIDTIEIYYTILARSNQAFRDFLSHLPDEILDWKISEYVVSTRILVEQAIEGQIWLLNHIFQDNSFTFPKPSNLYTVENLVSYFDDMVSLVEKTKEKYPSLDLNKQISYKEYIMTVEELLFELIHHLNHHGGQLSLIHNSWKRKNRMDFK